MRKRLPSEEQGSLFERVAPRPTKDGASAPRTAAKAAPESARKWRMPEMPGRTVAEIRLRWTKRLTPAQVARVEQELSTLPQSLTKLGFGTVQVERAFVRRRRA